MISIITLFVMIFLCVLGIGVLILGYKFWKFDGFVVFILSCVLASSIAGIFPEIIKRADVLEKK